MYFSPIRSILTVCLLALVTSVSSATARIEVESDYMAEVLPYHVTVERIRYPKNTAPIEHPVLPYMIAHAPGDSIITIYAYNGGGVRNDPAIVGVFNFRTSATIDDNPLRGEIGRIERYHDGGLGKDAVAVGYRRNDSAFIARFIPFRDGFDEIYLASRTAQSGENWVPNFNFPGVFDYDFDGNDEIFIQLDPGRAAVPNKLICVDLSQLRVEWQLDVAGTISAGQAIDCRDSANPGVIFVTYNPKHGNRSGTYCDNYCYLSRVDSQGRVLFQYVVAAEHGGVELTPLLNDSVFALTHSAFRTDPTDTLGISYVDHEISLVTTGGELVKSVDISGHPRQAWLNDFDGDGSRNVYALTGDGNLHVYDLFLNPVDSSGPTNLVRFVGRLALPGLDTDAMVFLNDTVGLIYDQDFEVIGELPRVNRFYTLETDSEGKTIQCLSVGMASAIYLKMRRQSLWERAHHWFFLHENYVLGAVAIMLGLVVMSLIARQRAAERLRVNERRAAATVKSTPDFIVRISKDGRYLDFHGSSQGTLPADGLDIVGKKMTEVMEPELGERMLHLVQKVIENKSLEIVEYEDDQRGTYRRYRAHVVAAGDDEVVATIRDVTKEYEALEQLKRSEARFRTLIESSPAAVLMHIESRIIFANYALEEITGYSVDEILNMTPVDLVCDEYKEAVRERIRARREGFDFTQMFELEALTKSGQRRWVAYRAAVVSFDSHDAIMVIIHDISDRKQAEARFLEMQQQRYEQIRQVAGGLAHEIYNSLYPVRTSIGQLSRLLKQEARLDTARIERLLALSDSAINRAVGLTELVSRYSRIEVPESTSNVNIAELAEEVAQQHAGQLEEKKITLTRDIPDGLTLQCSADHLYSVINNLVINAIDAINSHTDRTIRVSARPERQGVTISVSDSGCGMTDEVRRRIFDPFYSTKPRTGTGLGLAVVRRIVEICGGDIKVNSTIDKGTDFDVYFPQHTG